MMTCPLTHQAEKTQHFNQPLNPITCFNAHTSNVYAA